MSVNLPDPMTYCKARMLDANLYGRHLESEMFSRIITLLARNNALREAVVYYINCLDYATNHEAVIMARAEVDRLLNDAADCEGEG